MVHFKIGEQGKLVIFSFLQKCRQRPLVVYSIKWLGPPQQVIVKNVVPKKKIKPLLSSLNYLTDSKNIFPNLNYIFCKTQMSFLVINTRHICGVDPYIYSYQSLCSDLFDFLTIFLVHLWVSSLFNPGWVLVGSPAHIPIHEASFI